MSSEESDPNSMIVRTLPWRASLVDEFYEFLDPQVKSFDHLSLFVSLNAVY